jgi:hypothetical protein
MTTKSARRRRRTTLAPVTTIEEIPILDEEERANLIASLKQAEAEIRAGQGADLDLKAFKDRLVDIYRGKHRRE